MFSTHRVARDKSGSSLVDHDVEFCGKDRREELSYRGLRKCPRESLHLFAVADRDNRRDRLHEELCRKLLVCVDVDFCKLEGSAGLDGQTLKQGRQSLARGTPFSPEVDEDGHVTGSKEDFLLESSDGDVLDIGACTFHDGKDRW